MRGITEDELKKELLLCAGWPEAEVIVNGLIKQCKEINNWIPINENTPNDRPILIFFDGTVKFQAISQFNEETNQFAYQAFTECKPTHWQELPEAPK